MSKSLNRARLGLNPRVRYRAVGDDGVVVQMDSARVLVLNEVGLRVVELLASGQSVDALAASLVREFDAPAAEVQADLEQFLAELDAEQVLDGFSPRDTR
jgi:hypothetical protein